MHAGFIVRAVRDLCFVLLLISGFISTAHASGDESVGIITDIEGNATWESESPHDKDASILTEIAPESRMQLDSGSRLAILYTQSGEQYEFRGPAVIQFERRQPQVLSGAEPKHWKTTLGSDLSSARIRPVGVAQAALVMRHPRHVAKIKLLTLNDTQILDERPEFRWVPPEPGLQYTFELSNDKGRTIFSSRVQGDSLRLPATIKLKKGVHYAWQLATTLANGQRYSNIGKFSIALPKLQAKVEKLRPAGGASVADRVIFAAWLNEMELRDEARKYWREIAAARPDDSGLKVLAGQ
jgi:hypothetical protein